MEVKPIIKSDHSNNDLVQPFLPLGSVVLLKDSDHKMMITGRAQKEANSQELFDYCAVLWPEGMIDSTRNYLFNAQAIDKVLYLGLQDVQEMEWRNALNQEWTNLVMQSK